MEGIGMKKIYICGLAASGKGLMKQLLDGHSKLCMMPFQGFVLKDMMAYDFNSLEFNLKLSSPYRKKYYKYMPSFNITNGDSPSKIYLDEFIRHIYYSYDLYIASRSNKIWGEAGEGVEALIEFSFDYARFEEDWFDALFTREVNISIEEFLDIMYKCYFNNWKNKYIDTNNIQAMMTTVQNGIEPIKWLYKNTKNSKLLLMERDEVGFSYALANKKSRQEKKDLYVQLYNISIINLLNSYRKFSYSEEMRNNPRVLIVDFNGLVLDTHNTMIKVADFLEIEYEDILTKATLNRVHLESGGISFTGKINDNPYESLSSDAIDFLRYLYRGPGENSTGMKKLYFKVKACKLMALQKLNEWVQRYERLMEVVKKRYQ